MAIDKEYVEKGMTVRLGDSEFVYTIAEVCTPYIVKLTYKRRDGKVVDAGLADISMLIRTF